MLRTKLFFTRVKAIVILKYNSSELALIKSLFPLFFHPLNACFFESTVNSLINTNSQLYLIRSICISADSQNLTIFSMLVIFCSILQWCAKKSLSKKIPVQKIGLEKKPFHKNFIFLVDTLNIIDFNIFKILELLFIYESCTIFFYRIAK